VVHEVGIGCLRFGTGRASTFRFDGGTGHGEADAAGRTGQRLSHRLILDLGHAPTNAADQELRGMLVRWVVGPGNSFLDAADERREALDTMHETLLLKEVKGAIDSRRNRAGAAGAKPIQQVVSAGRACGVKNQSQHLAAQLSQADTALPAKLRRPIQQADGFSGKAFGHITSFAGIKGAKQSMDGSRSALPLAR
jgi:hypothetical protein